MDADDDRINTPEKWASKNLQRAVSYYCNI
jgi:hypothetical protein